jgi:hypothetical protein
MKIYTVILLSLLSIAAAGQKRDTCCHVEIYLLNGTYTFRPDNFSPIGYFMPERSYLAATPLVCDSEITGYEVPRDSMQPYYINLKEETAHRLDSIAHKAPPFDGLPIAVVVDGEPVFGAYIWNVASQFGCDWIMAMPFPGRLVLYPGIPHYCFNAAHPDPRGGTRIIDRMRRTYRVINH